MILSQVLVVYKNELDSAYSIANNVRACKRDYKCFGFHHFEPSKNMTLDEFNSELGDCILYTYEDYYSEDF